MHPFFKLAQRAAAGGVDDLGRLRRTHVPAAIAQSGAKTEAGEVQSARIGDSPDMNLLELALTVKPHRHI